MLKKNCGNSWERESAGPITVCTAEADILLSCCCCYYISSWTVWCSHVVGQKWCAHNCCWWLLRCWGIKKRTWKPRNISWEVTPLVLPFVSGVRVSGIANNYFQWIANVYLRWDDHSKDEFCSEQVQILFYVIYTTVNQLGAVASAIQNRDVRKHLIELVSFHYVCLFLKIKLFSTDMLNLSAVASAVEVYDVWGRMADEAICANNWAIHVKCSCFIHTGAHYAHIIVFYRGKDLGLHSQWSRIQRVI